jgi:hypothetical protein
MSVMFQLAVAGAHLTGLPLNHQLTELGAKLVKTVRTAPVYSEYSMLCCHRLRIVELSRQSARFSIKSPEASGSQQHTSWMSHAGLRHAASPCPATVPCLPALSPAIVVPAVPECALQQASKPLGRSSTAATTMLLCYGDRSSC